MPSQSVLEMVAAYRGRVYSEPKNAITAIRKDIKKGMDKIPAIMKKNLTRMIGDVEREMKRKHSSPWSRGARGKP